MLRGVGVDGEPMLGEPARLAELTRQDLTKGLPAATRAGHVPMVRTIRVVRQRRAAARAMVAAEYGHGAPRRSRSAWVSMSGLAGSSTRVTSPPRPCRISRNPASPRVSATTVNFL